MFRWHDIIFEPILSNMNRQEPNNSYRLIESCYHTIIPNKCLFNAEYKFFEILNNHFVSLETKL